VFQLTPPVSGGSWTYSVLAGLDQQSGIGTQGLILIGGNIFGSASFGGASDRDGTVFELQP